MAYLEYMLKCAGVPSGSTLTELLSDVYDIPADTLEKTASYSEGICTLGKMLHGTSGGEMYKLGRCTALCKFAYKLPKVKDPAQQKKLNEWFQLNSGKLQANQARYRAGKKLDAAKNTMNSMQQNVNKYQQNFNNADQRYNLMMQNPAYTAANATPELKQELADAKSTRDKHEKILQSKQQALSGMQTHVNNLQGVYDARNVDVQNVAPLTAAQQVQRHKLRQEITDLNRKNRPKKPENQPANQNQPANPANPAEFTPATELSPEMQLKYESDVADFEAGQGGNALTRGLHRIGNAIHDYGIVPATTGGVLYGAKRLLLGTMGEAKKIPVKPRSAFKTNEEYKQHLLTVQNAQAALDAKAAAARDAKLAPRREREAKEEQLRQANADKEQEQLNYERNEAHDDKERAERQQDKNRASADRRFNAMAIGGTGLGLGGLYMANSRPTMPAMYAYAPQPMPMPMPAPVPQQQQQ